MRLLALAATMRRFALLVKMARLQTIHAQTVLPHSRPFLVVRQGLEFDTRCLLGLHRTQRSLPGVVALATNDAKDLPGVKFFRASPEVIFLVLSGTELSEA